jgi:hypothetical protein
MLSGNVSYFFGRSRVRPYLTGSVGLLWTEGVNSLTIVSSTGATLSEFRQRDTGLALGVGFGVDVPLTRALSLRPEIQDLLVGGDVASESRPASRNHRHAISLVMRDTTLVRRSRKRICAPPFSSATRRLRSFDVIGESPVDVEEVGAVVR